MSRFKLLIIIPLIFLTGCYSKVPIERSSVLSGIGQDVIDKETLSSSFEFLVFSSENKFSKTVITNKGVSIFDIYNKRLLETKKNLIPGTIRLLLISEERAKLGVDDIIDVFLRDQDRNSNTTVAVCKGKTEDILNMTPKEATTISEEIEDLIKSAGQTNFTQADRSIKDVFNMNFQNGRRIMLPYVERYKDDVILNSIAVFQGNKMQFKIPTEDVKYINVLRNDKARGYLTLKGDNILVSSDIQCISKRKVSVQIDNGKINYNIKVNIKALLKEVNCNKFKELDKDSITKLENLFSNELKLKLQDEVNMYQKNYNLDVFDLQKYALAKLGKANEAQVDKNFKDSKINIEVKITITSTGRLIR